MRFLDKTLESFGFTQDTTIVAIICIVVLLGNFAGGLMANILIAFGGPIEKRKLTERTSFRLALVSELIMIVYIVYYHTILVTGVTTAQIIYWGFTLVAAPILASLGAQLTYIAFAKKIEQLKQDFLDYEKAQAQPAGGGGEDGDDIIDEDEA